MTYAVDHWLPGAKDPETGQRQPPTPCPDLLTEDEAARYLRLDEGATSDPGRSLRDLRSKEGIRALPLGNGNKLHYRLKDLHQFLEERLSSNRK